MIKNLLNSQDKLANAIFNKTTDAILIIDPEIWQIVDFNLGAQILTGYSWDNIPKMKLIEFFPKNKSDEIFKIFKDSSYRIKNTVIKVDFLTKNKEIVNTEGTLTKVELEGKKYILGNFRNVTKLNVQEEKYRKLVETSSDIIWETDEMGRYSFISPKIKDILGYDSSELLGNILVNPIKRGKEEREKEMMSLFKKKESFSGITKKEFNKNGNVVYLESSGVPILDENETFLGYIGTHRDVTERTKSEIKLLKAFEDLKELDKLKINFLTMTSHELKTPLTPIISQVQRLLEKELNKEKREEGLNIILRNIKRLERLINDIMEISRIQSDRLKIAKEKTDMVEIIEQNVNTLQVLAKERGIIINSKIGKLPQVFVDKYRIDEVFINLIDNSIKYSGTKEITVSAEVKGEDILVSISDKGKGISKIEQKKLFNPFHRGEAEKYHPGGAGIGLSICKGIIDAHKGKIWVKGELGKGVTFQFTIPINSKDVRKGFKGKNLNKNVKVKKNG